MNTNFMNYYEWAIFKGYMFSFHTLKLSLTLDVQKVFYLLVKTVGEIGERSEVGAFKKSCENSRWWLELSSRKVFMLIFEFFSSVSENF